MKRFTLFATLAVVLAVGVPITASAANAAPSQTTRSASITQVQPAAHGAICKAAKHQWRVVNGDFDKRYDKIFAGAIYPKACDAPAGQECKDASDYFAETSPYYKTEHDRGLAASVVAAACKPATS